HYTAPRPSVTRYLNAQHTSCHSYTRSCPGLTYIFFFFFNDTPTTEIYTLSLHDALPILHKMRCLLINRRSLLLALRLLWKTPIFPSNSRFPRLCAKCLLKLKRLVSILPMTKSKK